MPVVPCCVCKKMLRKAIQSTSKRFFVQNVFKYKISAKALAISCVAAFSIGAGTYWMLHQAYEEGRLLILFINGLDPLNSTLDKWYRRFLGNYRDYILVEEGRSKLGNGIYQYLLDPSFAYVFLHNFNFKI